VGEVLSVNGRRYRWMDRPLVVICIDGCGREYLTEAAAAGAAPFVARLLQLGAVFEGDCVVPSFTNPNNISIVTGVAPALHGICGNYFYDREADGGAGAEVMMNDPRYLRVGTVPAAFARAGARVAVVTAKDKLRALLGKDLDGICFSAERADAATREANGIDGVAAFVGMPVPEVYSAELSEFVLAAGVRLMQVYSPDLVYLSTTDYIQHKAPPGAAEANAFYAMIDRHLAALDAMGCTLAITADHGMNAKHGPDGRPNVVYLQTLFDQWLGEGSARVILPITDPYVVHHGSLGSFATVYLPRAADASALAARLEAVHGIERVLLNAEGCVRFELPPEREGDLLVISRADFVLGTDPQRHDLSGLDAPLRSHGGLSEQSVPLVFNRRTVGIRRDAQLRNFDILDVALNRLAQA